MADNIKDNIGSLDCTEKRSLKPFHSTPEMHEIIQVPLNSPENHTKQSVESERAGMLLHTEAAQEGRVTRLRLSVRSWALKPALREGS